MPCPRDAGGGGARRWRQLGTEMRCMCGGGSWARPGPPSSAKKGAGPQQKRWKRFIGRHDTEKQGELRQRRQLTARGRAGQHGKGWAGHGKG